MHAAQTPTVAVIDRLRVIEGLCQEIATRLEDEGSAQTIPLNFEYEGRRTALLDIAGEIGKTMQSLETSPTPNTVNESVQALFGYIERLKAQNEDAQARSVDYKHNFRMSGLYFTPRGAIVGCDKALDWLRESLKTHATGS